MKTSFLDIESRRCVQVESLRLQPICSCANSRHSLRMMVYDLISGRAKRGASGALNLQSALAGLDSLD